MGSIQRITDCNQWFNISHSNLRRCIINICWCESPSKHPIFKKKRFKICLAGSEHHVAPILNHLIWRKSELNSPNADTFSNGFSGEYPKSAEHDSSWDLADIRFTIWVAHSKGTKKSYLMHSRSRKLEKNSQNAETFTDFT